MLLMFKYHFYRLQPPAGSVAHMEVACYNLCMAPCAIGEEEILFGGVRLYE